ASASRLLRRRPDLLAAPARARLGSRLVHRADPPGPSLLEASSSCSPQMTVPATPPRRAAPGPRMKKPGPASGLFQVGFRFRPTAGVSRGSGLVGLAELPLLDVDRGLTAEDGDQH